MADLGEALKLLRASEVHPADVRLATPVDLTEAEVALGMAFPPDYSRFLLEASSERVGLYEPGLVGPGRPPHRDLARIARGAWDAWRVPLELFPFSTADGDYFCVAPDGRILYRDHEGLTEESWPDLASWIVLVWLSGQ